MILTSRITNHLRRRWLVRFGSSPSSGPPLSTTVVNAPQPLHYLLFALPASSKLHSQQPTAGSQLHTSAPRLDPVVARAARARAAAAAEEVVQEVLTDPSSETLHAVSLAFAAAAAATAVHFCSASRSHAREPSTLCHRQGLPHQLIITLADPLPLQLTRPDQMYGPHPYPARRRARPR